jgi:hypothetical protein
MSRLCPIVYVVPMPSGAALVKGGAHGPSLLSSLKQPDSHNPTRPISFIPFYPLTPRLLTTTASAITTSITIHNIIKKPSITSSKWTSEAVVRDLMTISRSCLHISPYRSTLLVSSHHPHHQPHHRPHHHPRLQHDRHSRTQSLSHLQCLYATLAYDLIPP